MNKCFYYWWHLIDLASTRLKAIKADRRQLSKLSKGRSLLSRTKETGRPVKKYAHQRFKRLVDSEWCCGVERWQKTLWIDSWEMVNNRTCEKWQAAITSSTSTLYWCLVIASPMGVMTTCSNPLIIVLSLSGARLLARISRHELLGWGFPELRTRPLLSYLGSNTLLAGIMIDRAGE